MDEVYFEPEKIRVVEGETVRFVVRNAGEDVHEFNIGTAHMHAEHQEEMMEMVEHGVIEGDQINCEMMDTDMRRGYGMAHDDPNSVLLEPGESAEIICRFTEAMDLEFAFNLPSHYDASMAGDFVFVNELARR